MRFSAAMMLIITATGTFADEPASVVQAGAEPSAYLKFDEVRGEVRQPRPGHDIYVDDVIVGYRSDDVSDVHSVAPTKPAEFFRARGPSRMKLENVTIDY